MPRRIQRKRTKGWRMPANAVYVGRPTKWGNPHRGTHAVAFHKADLFNGKLPVSPQDVARELRGKDLACWCPLDQRCHADVLLELANA